GSTGTTIGGIATLGASALGASNVISGNQSNNVIVKLLSGATSIQGNYIGTNGPAPNITPGTVALSSTTPGVNGVLIMTNGVTIGGTAAGAGNLISGNSSNGVSVRGVSDVLIQGNLIGVNSAASAALPNENGIAISQSTGATVSGNTVSGNKTTG